MRVQRVSAGLHMVTEFVPVRRVADYALSRTGRSRRAANVVVSCARQWYANSRCASAYVPSPVARLHEVLLDSYYLYKNSALPISVVLRTSSVFCVPFPVCDVFVILCVHRRNSDSCREKKKNKTHNN